jgi:hypothetical protein
MTRTFNMTTWGSALLLAAFVLASERSLPGALAAAGAVLMIVGAVKAMIDGYVGIVREEDAKANGQAAEQRANPSAFDQRKSDAF